MSRLSEPGVHASCAMRGVMRGAVGAAAASSFASLRLPCLRMRHFPPPGVVAMPPESDQSNPMHGVTLERVLNELVAHYGWNAMGQKIEIRCFTTDPSVGSSLKFLRRTPWARQKVEAMYRDLLRVRARQPKV